MKDSPSKGEMGLAPFLVLKELLDTPHVAKSKTSLGLFQTLVGASCGLFGGCLFWILVEDQQRQQLLIVFH